jgi:hypothetical protein
MNIEKLKNLVYDFWMVRTEQIDKPNVPDRVAIPALNMLEKLQMEDEDTIQRFEALVARMEDFENKQEEKKQ